ncbi:hypothetical protein [Bacillus thuringiensis]|uniref:hypothetical protein n=1 Tax=Bacillus thuringiensis TaxID=1428 RepID=UPI002AB5D80F|nr:hypothetical protein [Bacillus thuringiensis]MDY7962082.1 hypothetical protein [Bacillus thuringiensis]
MSANVESAMSGYTIVHVTKQNKIVILMGETKMKSTIEGLMIILLIILFAIGQVLNN